LKYSYGRLRGFVRNVKIKGDRENKEKIIIIIIIIVIIITK
jgi:hypothetical protein